MKRASRWRSQISFQLRHPSNDLAPISSRLGLRPSVIWKKGDQRYTPKGTPLRGFREDSYCTFRLGYTSKEGLAKHLGNALRRLKPHRATLRRFLRSGGTLSFFVSWHLDGNTGEIFTRELLSKMADFGIALDLDVYIPYSASRNSNSGR